MILCAFQYELLTDLKMAKTRNSWEERETKLFNG